MYQVAAERLYAQGLNMMTQSRTTSALQALKQAVVLDDSSRVLNVLGLCYYQLGDFESASAAWKKSLLKESANNPAGNYLNDLQSASMVQLCEEYQLALTYMQQERYKEAKGVLLKGQGAECFPSFANLLGLAYYSLNKRQKAFRYWSLAYEMDQDNPLTRRYIKEVSKDVYRKKSCRSILENLLEA